MKRILKVDNPNVYARHVGAPVLHPLLSVVHFDEVSPLRNSLNNYGVYGLFIQREFPNNLSYGMKKLQVGDNSIVAVAPGQIGGGEDNGEELYLSGWAVLWSPELMRNSDLEERIREYQFFSYFAIEPLHTTESEWSSITQLFAMMRDELLTQEDSPSLQDVLLGYLRLILEYCNRIYQRQIANEDIDISDLLKRFNALLGQYYHEGWQMEKGVPSVSYCARELAYSSHYFGDLIHRATGSTAIRYIHSFVINQGKNLLMTGHNVNETSHLLGFDYPHHFTRLFKKIVGITPSEFIKEK